MRRTALPLLVLALVATAAGACADAEDRLDDARVNVIEVSDQVRFCISVARALSNLDEGVPSTAESTAEELLAQVPDHLRDDARLVADALRGAGAGDLGVFEDPAVRAAAERLRDGASELCMP